LLERTSVRFVLDKHPELYVLIANSLKQQLSDTCRYVASLGHVILTALNATCAYIHFVDFGFTRPMIELPNYHTRGDSFTITLQCQLI